MNQPENEQVFALNSVCSLEDHRSCELATAVGMAADISEQEGVALSPQLQRIIDSQVMTETSVRSALREWLPSIPEKQQEVAEKLLGIVEYVDDMTAVGLIGAA